MEITALSKNLKRVHVTKSNGYQYSILALAVTSLISP